MRMEHSAFLNRMSPNEIRLFRTPDGSLHLELEGVCFTRVTLVRSFPYTMPDKFISVRSAEGREMVMIQDVNALAEESLHVALEELRRHDMLPVVQQILSVRKKGSEWHLQVGTDFGPTDLVMDYPHEHIRRVTDSRWLLTDKEGRRFFLCDLERMDARSRKLWKQLS